MSVLAPCPGCSRHVRADKGSDPSSSRSCPFCGASLAGLVAPARPVVPRGLGRAAIMSFGAAAVAGTLAVSGCAGRDGDGGGGGTDSGPRTDSGMMPDEDAGGGVDSGLPAPAYGGPVDVDAGPPDDQDAGGGDVPLYGAPP